MSQILPSASRETDRLEVVVLGLPDSVGRVPSLEETYDARSYESVSLGVYPTQTDITCEMNGLLAALERNGVTVLRPSMVEEYNQIFARDVAFVVDDTLFVSNLLPDRGEETAAFNHIFERIPSSHLERLPERVHTEGGDVLLGGDYLFVGCYLRSDYPTFKTARTNQYAIDFFKERFPNKTIIPIELRKDDHDPRKGILHLDCAFQPVGQGKALLYREGLLRPSDVGVIEEIFGKDNIFGVTPEEAVNLSTNIVSLSPSKIISDASFVRMNAFLSQEWGIEVEAIPYQEICKMGGLLRCSTMPLVRKA